MVFRVTTNGVLTSLGSFNTTNGAYPTAPLVFGPDGSLYGTTGSGGSNNEGTVFRVTTNGVLTSLVLFNRTNGRGPNGLVLGNDGSFYGTTDHGGASDNGTVFKVTTNGVLTSLMSFNGTNGRGPNDLVLGKDGNFYGTTWGDNGSNNGMVFKVTPDGILTSLVSFDPTAGLHPAAPMVLGPDGSFYGTTSYGGSDDSGTVFRVTTNGVLSPLVSFSPAMGQNTSGDGLVFGRDGNLYGTTHGGGNYDAGTVFQVALNGSLTTLISFDGTNGGSPEAGLTLGPDGSFYGTTARGGAGGMGTVFRFMEPYGLPEFLSPSADRTNDAGTSVTFSAGAVGSQPLGYQWRKDAAPLADGGNLSGAGTSVLLLTNLLGGDAGSYSVVVSNGFGSVTSVVARLTVLDPAIAVQPASQNQDPGQSVVFNVTAAGTIPLGYQWWKDGLALTQRTNSSLLLTNLQASDSGQYRVVVSSRYGSVTSAIAWLSLEKPVTVDPEFNPGASSDVVSSDVYSLAVQADGKVLVGGGFTTLGGQARNYIGRLTADGILDSGFNPGANSSVGSLAVQADGKILVGGGFTMLGGQARNHIGRLNADGTLDSGFNPGANSSVGSLAVQADGKVLVGGFFTTLGGPARNYIGRLTADGILDSGFNPGANGPVVSLAVTHTGFLGLWGEGVGRLLGQRASLRWNACPKHAPDAAPAG